MVAIVYYDGGIVGKVHTNRSLTLQEALELIDIDIDAMLDEDTPMYDPSLFSMEYERAAKE